MEAIQLKQYASALAWSLFHMPDGFWHKILNDLSREILSKYFNISLGVLFDLYREALVV